MGAAAPLPAPLPPAETDQRVVLHHATWEQYESILQARGDDPGLRITDLDGELELGEG